MVFHVQRLPFLVETMHVSVLLYKLCGGNDGNASGTRYVLRQVVWSRPAYGIYVAGEALAPGPLRSDCYDFFRARV